MHFKVIISFLFLCHLTYAETEETVQAVEAVEAVQAVEGVETDTKIASGQDSKTAENLDYAYLDIVFQNQFQRCGATLFQPQYLLTSATCVIDPAEGLATKINVTFPNVKEVNTQLKIYPHPGYNPTTHENDIAVIKLTKPMKPDGKTVALAQLASDPTADIYANKVLRACGMGSIANYPKPPKKLQCTDVNGVAAASCSANSGIICTQWPDRDNNLCNGDYGGPLYLTSLASGSLTQTVVGIAQYAVNLRPSASCFGGHSVSYAQIGANLGFITTTLVQANQ